MLRKIFTALRLAARLDFAALQRRWQYNRGLRLLERHGNRPFLHRLGGHRLICFPDQPDSVAQLLEGGDDLWEMQLLEHWLQAGDSFIDAGANLGLYAQSIAGKFSGEVRVLALEASPHLAANIRQSASLLGVRNLEVIPVVVGAKCGEVEFQLARPGRTTVSQSMKIGSADASDYERHILPMDSLAGLAARHLPAATPAAVKLDVEGAEPLALEGAPPAWLGSDGPLWLIEVNPSVLARMGYDAGSVLRHFRPEAHELWLMPKYPHAGQPAPAPRRYDPAESFADAAFYNLIAVPRGQLRASRRARLTPFLP